MTKQELFTWIMAKPAVLDIVKETVVEKLPATNPKLTTIDLDVLFAEGENGAIKGTLPIYVQNEGKQDEAAYIRTDHNNAQRLADADPLIDAVTAKLVELKTAGTVQEYSVPVLSAGGRLAEVSLFNITNGKVVGTTYFAWIDKDGLLKYQEQG